MEPLKWTFCLLCIIAYSCSRNPASASHKIPEDLEKNESQIEIPPILIPPREPKVVKTVPNVDDASADLSTEQLPKSEGVLEGVDTVDPDIPLIPGFEDESNISEMAIPVFSEWTQQQMQEAEKKLVELTNASESNKDIKNETLAKHQVIKMRQKNYASPDCGAKVLASNPEAQSTSGVLTDKDEYLLSPCTDRIWFVVELCDSIQAKRVELANFELFSSPLKSVQIGVSNRFPTREWTFAGQFDVNNAKSERDVQVLELSSSLFGKFVRVDLTYTNTEHYCPLSFFRIYGTSEIEAFEVENEAGNDHAIDDDDDELELHAKEKDQNKDNLLNRAGAAVMTFVQKAAEALVKNNGHGSKLNGTSVEVLRSGCKSVSHQTLCKNCSSEEKNELDDLISCKSHWMLSILAYNEDIPNHLIDSGTCHDTLGFDLKGTNSESKENFILSIIAQKYVNAMCNLVAMDQKILPLRTEEIPDVSSGLLPQKDEVSLKNISKKEDSVCNEGHYSTVAPPTESLNEKEVPVTTEEIDDQKNVSLSDSTDSREIVASESKEGQEEEAKALDPSMAPSTIQSDSNEAVDIVESSIPQETTNSLEAKVLQPPEVKHSPGDGKTETAEKLNGDVRSSNPPESVFLRLSNRIKTLEKNMTLSTQYLEELSRRYKKQIEDLQQTFSKMQVMFEDQNSRKRENDKKENDEKLQLRKNVAELSQKADYLEVIVIVISAFVAVQTMLVIALFKRISILRSSFVSEQNKQASPLPSPLLLNGDKTRPARKRSKQRTRKISAPNILTQRSQTQSDFMNSEPVLCRTFSAPNKFNLSAPVPENKENYNEMHAMLEENDDILIPGFDELKISDEISSNDIDTASTASIASSRNDRPAKSSSSRRFQFKRRLSSPFQSKKSSKDNTQRTNQKWTAKAKSESPPSIKHENSVEFRKSKSSFEDDDGSMKFKKSNSLKKLLKKIF